MEQFAERQDHVGLIHDMNRILRFLIYFNYLIQSPKTYLIYLGRRLRQILYNSVTNLQEKSFK